MTAEWGKAAHKVARNIQNPKRLNPGKRSQIVYIIRGNIQNLQLFKLYKGTYVANFKLVGKIASESVLNPCLRALQ